MDHLPYITILSNFYRESIIFNHFPLSSIFPLFCILYFSAVISKLTGAVTLLQEHVVGLQRSFASIQRQPQAQGGPSPVIDKFYPTFKDMVEFDMFCSSIMENDEEKEKLVRF